MWLLILVNIWSQVCTKFKLIVSTAIIISTWQVTIIVKNIEKFVGFNYHVYLLTVFHRLDALIMRFETPDSRNRWDSPLFLFRFITVLLVLAWKHLHNCIRWITLLITTEWKDLFTSGPHCIPIAIFTARPQSSEWTSQKEAFQFPFFRSCNG